MPIKHNLQKQAVADLARGPEFPVPALESQVGRRQCVGEDAGWKLEAGLLMCVRVSSPSGFEIIEF